MTMNLADIIRSIKGPKSRQALKVERARLRRMGLTNLPGRANGPYTVAQLAIADARTRVIGAVITAAVAS